MPLNDGLSVDRWRGTTISGVFSMAILVRVNTFDFVDMYVESATWNRPIQPVQDTECAIVEAILDSRRSRDSYDESAIRHERDVVEQ